MAEAEQKKIKVTIEADIPETFKPSLDKIRERKENLSRISERGLINEVSGAALVARDDGQINLSASEYAQYKLNPDGKAIEASMESVTITNRKRLEADDIVINGHKLNPQLYELTDLKQVLGDTASAVGNFCVWGTVLAKCWEPDLGRYVMMRRQVCIPMFSRKIGVPEILPGLRISDPLKKSEEMVITKPGGYQVNGPVTDSNSLISTDTPSTKNSRIVENMEDKAGETKHASQSE